MAKSLEELKKEAMDLGIDEKDLEGLKPAEVKAVIEENKKMEDLKVKAEALGVDTEGKNSIDELNDAIVARLEAMNSEKDEKIASQAEAPVIEKEEVIKLKVDKPFWYRGKKYKPGDKLEVDRTAYEEFKVKGLVLEY